MFKNVSKFLVLLAALGLLVSCGKKPKPAPLTFQAENLNAKLQSGWYVPKVDNFMIIMDGSTSMGDKYHTQKKIDIARDFASQLNRSIPTYNLNGALRTFGQGPCLPNEATSLIYGMRSYSDSALGEAIGKVTCIGGTTPMETALAAAGKDLEASSGNTALIIISDGIVIDKLPYEAAGALKAMYGDKLCIYAVQVGAHPGGKATMEKIAKIGGCGFAVTADDLASSAGLASFVEKVFLAPTMDSDGDGVPDPLDQCPNTPRGTPVDSRGCPKVVSKAAPGDADGDGVPDDRDKCPNTPMGARVDVNGCWILRPVQFDFDKYNIKSEYYAFLNEVATVLNGNPALTMAVRGHTDNVGADAYNQRLSERRAQAVVEYFVSKGINRDKFHAVGFGFSKPVATNKTPEGRAWNRRAELSPIK
jgi:OOP family OmpA-OmpF porin